MKMQKVDITVIKKQHEYYDELDHLCFLSKNLYNATIYCVRQQYLLNNRKRLSYYELNRKFTKRDQEDYRALPAKVSKAVMMLVDRNMKSFKELQKMRYKGEYNKPVRLPKYLHKEKGRQVVHYEKGAINKGKREGYFKLSGTEIYIRINTDLYTLEEVTHVSIIPKGNHITIAVGYKVNEPETLKDNGRYASIDLGVNNLAVIASNVTEPIIINGKPLKLINQYYNKEISRLKSKLPKGRYTSKKIEDLYKRRGYKIKDYMHKASRYIVNHLVSNNINTLVLGYNQGWKQDTRMGKVSNQNFVSIPFYTFKNMLEYKCKTEGITVNVQEESYTSKVSFIDNEDIKKHETYLGKREQRGLFRSGTGQTINADLNGSLNILKKNLIKNELWDDRVRLDCIAVSSSPNLTKVTRFQ